VSVEVGVTECDVTQSPYNAKGDGKTNDTAAIQHALDSCGNGNGGKVMFPTGYSFLIDSLTITHSNTEMNIASGSKLLVSNDMKKFPVDQSIIQAKKVNNIAITGGGTVDGQGLVWWQEMKKPGKSKIFRPHMVGFSDVVGGLLTDTQYINGPNHILELGCNNCELAFIKVFNPPSTGDCESTNTCSHNTDAVDVHGDPFYVHNVNFTTGDDNVAGHANNTLVEDSYFGSGHGASIGSLCDNWLHNITFRNITFVKTTSGAKIKAHPGCAGHVWNVTYENLQMSYVPTTISLSMFYSAPNPPKYNTSTDRFTNIVFRNIVSTKTGSDQKGKDAIVFQCDTTYDKTNGNCDVVIDGLHLPDVEKDSKMECTGVYSESVKDLVGVDSCLKSAPHH